MTKSQRIFRVGAIAAGLSTLMLVMIAFVVLPCRMSYPGVEALSGELTLSSGDLESYLHAMQTLFILDGIFLPGWIISWAGIAEIVSSRYRILGIMTLVFGLVGALLDIGENSIVWGGIQNLQEGRPLNGEWIITWKAVQHMSYWLPFIGAVFAAFGLWSVRTLDKIAAIIGSVLVIVAIFGLYWPGLSLLPNLWFLLWFACSGLLLWRHAAELSPNS